MGILAGTNPKSDDVNDLIVIYKHMIDSRTKIQTLKDQNKPFKDEEVRYYRLEMRVNQLWASLEPSKHIQVVADLVEADYMSQMVADALTVLGGKVDQKEPATPNYKITQGE